MRALRRKRRSLTKPSEYVCMSSGRIYRLSAAVESLEDFRYRKYLDGMPPPDDVLAFERHRVKRALFV